jgi:DNA-binding beta-propeller fold protein YncE
VFDDTLAGPGSGDGLVEGPGGVSVDSRGTVYIADTWNHRIQQFTATGDFVRTWGSFGSALGQFATPISVASSSTRNLFVMDTQNHRVQRLRLI